MNRTLTLSLATVAVAAALAAGYWAGNRTAGPGSHVAAGGEANPPAAAGAERKILYYRNPMGLPDTSPEPKKDSMGMDYIPVYADDTPDDSGVVKVSPARVQILGVKTALAEARVLDAAVRAVGRIEVNERAVVDVAPRFEGWIERLYVNATGDTVKKGQPLFSVYSPELASAQKELAIAETLGRDAAAGDPAAHAGAARLAEATRERLRNWDIALPAGGGVPQRLTFTSPATGIVLEKKAVQGTRFMPGEAIYRIADLSTVWVIADVYEQDLAQIRIGQRADVTVDAFPGRRFEARIAYLYPTVEAATRSTPVRLELANRDGLLRPGMFAHVELATDARAPRVTVPTSAVIDDGARQVVLHALDEGRFKPQPVKLGVRGRDYVEVLEGIAAGDRVVVSANFLIDAESNLRAALSNLGEGDPDAAAAAPGAAASYQADGTLEQVDRTAGTASISHGPVPALQWPAMTMEFAMARPDVFAGMAPGSRVRFEFEQREPGEFFVTRVEPLTAPPPAPAAARGTHGGH